MANIAQSINVISPLTTTEFGIVKQTTWWQLLLFGKYMQGHTVAVSVQCAEYEGPTAPSWIRDTIERPWLDVSATISDDRWVSMAVVNVNENKNFETRLEEVGSVDVQVFRVTGQNVGVVNAESREEVGIQESRWNGKGLFSFSKHSLTLLRWKI